MSELDTIIAYLLGECPLDGVWFEQTVAGRAPYWWRTPLRQALAALRPSAVEAAPGVEDVGAMDRSAPERVWLQVDTDGNPEDRSEVIRRENWTDLTWHYEPIGGQEVEYIRADLATPAAAPAPADGRATTEDSLEVAAAFLATAFYPDFDDCPPELQRAYRYWQKRLLTELKRHGIAVPALSEIVNAAEGAAVASRLNEHSGNSGQFAPTSAPTPADGLASLAEIAAIIEAVDNRAQFADGHVPTTMQAMTQAEMSRIYALAKGAAL